MPIDRGLAVPLTLLVLACGDGEGDDSSNSNSSATDPTGITGVTLATTTATATDATGASASSETSAGDGSGATSPNTDTTPGPTDPGVTDGGPAGTTSTTDGDTTVGDPFTTSASETTAGGSGDTTAGDPLCKQQIDIVFSMDVSTSMYEVLQKLEDEILTVDAKLKSLDVLPDVHYGLVVFVDDSKIINMGAPYADVQTLKQDFNFWWKFTQSNAQVNGGGSNGDWPENSIDALYTAAYAFQWRPLETTLRLVIHCTDDTFGDKGANQSGEVVQHSYDETVQGLQDRHIRVFAFADNDMTGGPGENQDVSMGFFTPYAGKTPIPDATDGGAFNINLVSKGQLSLSAAINDSVEQSLCQEYIPL